MKIALISPQSDICRWVISRSYNVGLSYIGTVLKDRGHEVEIYNETRQRIIQF